MRIDESDDAWQRWTTRFLFPNSLQNVELILRRFGGGINVDLATRSLLLEFSIAARGDSDGNPGD